MQSRTATLYCFYTFYMLMNGDYWKNDDEEGNDDHEDNDDEESDYNGDYGDDED